MAFDISTAQPIKTGFDISTAKPIDTGDFSSFESRGRQFSDPFGSRLIPAQKERKKEEKVLSDLRSTAPKGTKFARDLPEISEAPELQNLDMEALKPALASFLITNEAELANALERLIPGSQVTQDPEGKPSIKTPSGEFAINKPGPSRQDFDQFISRFLAFLPAGKIVGSGAKQLAKGALAAGGTEALLQSAEAGLEGEFNPEQVAIAGAIQPVAQAVPGIASGVKRLVQGEAAPAAKELIEEGGARGVRVLTSDVFPPESFFGKSFQQLSEKLGPLGTGSARASQQRARTEVVDELAQRLGVSLDNTAQTTDIIGSLSKGVAKRLSDAGQLRGEAVKSLNTFGDVPLEKTAKAIDDQIANQLRLKGQGSQELIEKLTTLKDDLQAADFGLVKDFRSNLIDDISAAFRGEALPTKSVAPLQNIKSSMDADLLSFAKNNDRQAAAKWVQSNKLFAENLGKVKDTELKRIIQKGTDTPEIVARTLKGGKVSELKRLNSFLDDTGKASARVSIVRDALEESGFFKGSVNPDRFVTAMQKPARQRAVGVFFKGADKKEIEGITRLLDATRRAQQSTAGTTTGLAEFVPGAVGGSAIAGLATNPFATVLTGGTLATATKGYESKLVRDTLLKLANTPKGSAAEQRILNEVMPSILAAMQSTRAQEAK